MKLHVGASLLAWTMASTLAAPAAAEETRPARVHVSVGAHIIVMDTDTSVSRRNFARGTKLDVERDLGLDDDETAIVLGARVRLGRRHTIALSQITLDREGDAVLTRELQIGDERFSVSADTESIYDYDMTHLDYRFAFYQTDAVDLKIAAGLSRVDFDFQVTATGRGPIGVIAEEGEADDFLVPSLGLGFQYRFSPDLFLRMSVTHFAYDDGDWDASMTIAGAHVEYYPWKHVGFGLGYDFVDIDYDEKGDDQFDTEFAYQGVALRLIGRF